MTAFSTIKRYALEYIDRYFAAALSATNLHDWALAHPTFTNPKALDNDEDWALNNALALMIALTDTAKVQAQVEEQLRQAQRFLAGEQALPKDRWPVGLLSTKDKGGS